MQAIPIHHLFVATLLALAAASSLAPAAPVPTWITPGNGSWAAGTNWLNGVVATGSGVTADFSTLNLAADATVTLDGARTVGALVFGDTTPDRNWTLNTGTGGPLTLDAGSAVPTISVTNRTATLNTVLAGTHGLIKTGAGVLALTAANSYTGGTTVNGGTLKLDLTARSNNTALNLGTLNVNASGTLELYDNAAANYGATALFSAGTALTGAGIITKTGTGIVDLWNNTVIKNFTGLIDIQQGVLANQTSSDWSTSAGAMSLNVASGAYFDLRTDSAVIDKLTGSGTIASSYNAGMRLTVGAQNGSSTFDGVIKNNMPTLAGLQNSSGTVALTKAGTGTLTLSGTNTYSGATNISAGTLRVTTNQTQVPSGLKIMPLGDSITYGFTGTNAGYRGYLHTLLAPVAPGFQFIGVTTVNPASLPTSPIDQTHHTGYSSYATLDLHNNLDGVDTTRFIQFGTADRDPQGGYWITGGNGTGRGAAYPDVVLLMVGTNDIGQQVQYNNPQLNVANYPANLTTLIGKLFALRPNVRVIVAKITPWAAQSSRVASINSSVASVAASFQSQGKAVTVVDMNTGFPANGLNGDGVHPNDTGYAWMAGQWHDAIVAAVGAPSSATAALPAATTVTVAAGAALDLNHTQSTVAGLNVSGSVLLGSGTLTTTAPATFVAGSVLAASVNRDDQRAGHLAVTGNLALGNAALNLSTIGTGALNSGAKFTLATYTGTLGGTFSGLPEGSALTIAGTPFLIRYADSGKNITLTVTTTPYQAWLSTKSPALTGDDTLSSADPDHDGTSNLLEFALGGDPGSSDLSILPQLQVTTTDFVFTFTRRVDSATDTTQVFGYSSDLASWTPLNITGTPGAGVVIGAATGTPPNEVQTVTITIPRTSAVDGKLFGRLQVTQP